MTFNEYQAKTQQTAAYPEKGEKFIYPTLAMMGEAGEVAEKVKKVWRDKAGILSEGDRVEIKKELGDVLWYLSQLATELGIELEDVAQTNIDKIQSRMERGVLNGSGDNR